MERRGPIECHECGAEIWPDEDYLTWRGHCYCMECGKAQVIEYLDDAPIFRRCVRELAVAVGFTVEHGTPVW